MRFFLIAALTAAAVLVILKAPGGLARELKTDKTVTIVVEKGASSKSVAFLLAKERIIPHPYGALAGIVILKAMKKPLKYGEYRFEPSDTLWGALLKIANGDAVMRFLTIPEGLTVNDVIHKLNAIEVLTGTIETVPAEGSLLPQTYAYGYGDSREGLLKRMRDAMNGLKAKLWEKRESESALKTWEEVLTLASIVEKETALAEERPMVASVYINRLKRGMPLQADPTVVYAVTGGKTKLERPISKADLKLESPHNTYARANLPPTPVACPGEASVMAVLNPADSDFLYFVANGEGGHEFSANFNSHRANVRQWRAAKAAKNERKRVWK